MDPTRIGILDLARRRMAWAEQRQALLAKNIANANTPKFRPSDLPAFAATMSALHAASPERTHPNHLSGTNAGATGASTVRSGLRNPDGNAVALDQQLTKVADTETTQALTTTIYKKYMGLFAIALGKGG
jgi:flagellar basal-body rod protein FlgB